MIHMGIDLSLTGTGVVVLDDTKGPTTPLVGLVLAGLAVFPYGEDQILHKEVIGFSLKRDDPEGVQLGRMLSITARICKIAKDHGVEKVRVEGPAYNAMSKLFYLGGLAFTVRGHLRIARKLECETVPPASARKEVFGRGQKPRHYEGKGPKSRWVKEWVAEELVKACGLELGEDNLNDALVQALCSIKREAQEQ